LRPSQRRALAVIAKEPAPGQAKTRLAPALGPDGAARAAAAMLADTIAAARTANAEPWLCFAPVTAQAAMRALAPGFGLLPQRDGDLGDRLAACLDELLAAGADRVAIVGADTPHVPAGTFDTALDLLDEADVVLGPALDGGYYLVAAKAPVPLFAGVPMGTDAVFAATLARATAAGLSVRLLPPLRDLDRPGDLAAALDGGELAASPLTRAAVAELLGRSRA
jgi:rSAM/selenodomain-associated transferase 1